jgi:hypothetical protein
MEKVVSSSLIIRSQESPGNGAFSFSGRLLVADVRAGSRFRARARPVQGAALSGGRLRQALEAVKEGRYSLNEVSGNGPSRAR